MALPDGAKLRGAGCSRKDSAVRKRNASDPDDLQAAPMRQTDFFHWKQATTVLLELRESVSFPAVPPQNAVWRERGGRSQICSSYFLLLRIKNNLSLRPRPEDWPDGRKIACGYFLLLRIKNNLFLRPRPEDWPDGRKIACGYFLFQCRHRGSLHGKSALVIFHKAGKAGGIVVMGLMHITACLGKDL